MEVNWLLCADLANQGALCKEQNLLLHQRLMVAPISRIDSSAWCTMSSANGPCYLVVLGARQIVLQKLH